MADCAFVAEAGAPLSFKELYFAFNESFAEDLLRTLVVSEIATLCVYSINTISE